MDIAAGTHQKLHDNEELRAAAHAGGAKLIDVRVPPANVDVGSGVKRPGKRVLMVGTDCAVGKKYSALALHRELAARGVNADFRATGQTGILIAGEGMPMDAVVADFVSGAAEQLSPDNADDHWDVIEGQGSLLHPGYAAVSLGLLHGSQPDAIVVCHRAGAEILDGLDVDVEIPPLNEVAEAALALVHDHQPELCLGGHQPGQLGIKRCGAPRLSCRRRREVRRPLCRPGRDWHGGHCRLPPGECQMTRRVSVHLENWMALIPFRIARNTWNDFPSVVCEIEQDGAIGRGEGLGVYYLGEDQESMLAQIESISDRLAAGAGRAELLRLLPPGGARCAVDAALWDLEAQLAGTSAWANAGVTEDPVETVFTIGLEAEPEEMGARAAAAESLTLFKVKLNNDRPVERIAAIRAAKPDARLVVDVNEGWEFDQLVEVAPALAELGVSMIEQPLRRGHDQELRATSRHCHCAPMNPFNTPASWMRLPTATR